MLSTKSAAPGARRSGSASVSKLPLGLLKGPRHPSIRRYAATQGAASHDQEHAMQTYRVYILRCADGSYFTGITAH